MSEPLSTDTLNLDALRREIDRIDDEMHGLLMRRAGVIEELIAAKRLGNNTGSAFRPDREATMIRRLAARHAGGLPLPVVEHIWREIIGAFTQLQAGFSIHAAGAGDPGMRDLLRFQFGFATPIVGHSSAGGVLAAMREREADLGVVPLDGGAGHPWWEALSEEPGGIKVIAALPFLHDGAPRALVLGPAAIGNPDASVRVCSVPSEAAGDGTLLARAGETALLALSGGPGGSVPAAGRVLGSYSTLNGA